MDMADFTMFAPCDGVPVAPVRQARNSARGVEAENEVLTESANLPLFDVNVPLVHTTNFQNMQWVSIEHLLLLPVGFFQGGESFFFRLQCARDKAGR